jgi:integrase
VGRGGVPETVTQGVPEVRKTNVSGLVKRGGRYYLRRRIPQPLQDHFGGKEEVRISLHTGDLRLARAVFAKESSALETMLVSLMHGIPLSPSVKPLAALDRELVKARHSVDTQRRAIEEAVRDGRDPAGFEAGLEVLEDNLAERSRAILPHRQGVPGGSMAERWYSRAVGNTETVLEAVERWNAASPGLSDGTKMQRVSAIRSALEALGMDPKVAEVDDLKPDTGERIVTEYRNSGKAVATARATLAHLGGLAKFLKLPKDIWRAEVRTTSFANPSGSRPPRRHYTLEELRKLMTAEAPQNALYLPDLAKLMLMTGMRIGEASGLLPEDVEEDGDEGWFLTVREGKTQAAARVVYLDAKLYGFSKIPVNGTGYPHKLHTKRVVSNRYTDWRRTCGVPDGTDAHSFRRAFGFALEEADVDGPTADVVFGHKPRALLSRVYAKGASSGRIKKACRAAQGVIAGWLSGAPAAHLKG